MTPTMIALLWLYAVGLLASGAGIFLLLRHVHWFRTYRTDTLQIWPPIRLDVQQCRCGEKRSQCYMLAGGERIVVWRANHQGTLNWEAQTDDGRSIPCDQKTTGG